MYFDEHQAARLAALAKEFQERTGADLTTAVVDRSDSYPEVPWKVFALMVCTHGLIHLMQVFLHPDRAGLWTLHSTLGFILGTSAAVALLAHLWEPFGRVFLSTQKSVRARRYAAEVFFERGLHRAPAALLMLVSLYEREIVFLTGSAAAALLPPDLLMQVKQAMLPLLRQADHFNALVRGIETLQAACSAGRPDPAGPHLTSTVEPLLELECSDG